MANRCIISGFLFCIRYRSQFLKKLFDNSDPSGARAQLQFRLLTTLIKPGKVTILFLCCVLYFFFKKTAILGSIAIRALACRVNDYIFFKKKLKLNNFLLVVVKRIKYVCFFHNSC